MKTWDIRYWERMGRCVRPNQVAALARKADGIVWCFVNEPTQEVTIAGWSTVAEVARLPILLTGPGGRELENHQMAVDAMRSLEQLDRLTQ